MAVRAFVPGKGASTFHSSLRHILTFKVTYLVGIGRHGRGSDSSRDVNWESSTAPRKIVALRTLEARYGATQCRTAMHLALKTIRFRPMVSSKFFHLIFQFIIRRTQNLKSYHLKCFDKGRH